MMGTMTKTESGKMMGTMTKMESGKMMDMVMMTIIPLLFHGRMMDMMMEHGMMIVATMTMELDITRTISVSKMERLSHVMVLPKEMLFMLNFLTAQRQVE